MTIAESLQNVTHLFLDTAPIIYYVEENRHYVAIVDPVFDLILEDSIIGVTSPVTLAECLIYPYRFGQTQLQQDYLNLIVRTNNIIFAPIADPGIALQAAQIRAKYNLQLLDAFQVAVALIAGCEAFLTNDVTFRRITELRVLVLDELDIAE